nr:methyltransferase domain-containing protein [uncultured Flavobacterium sp.]
MNIDKLKKLYQNTSKHSNYQTIHDSLKKYLDTNELTIHSRFEAERMSFVNNYLDFKDKKVVDVGGNTGYFSFESIAKGAREVVYIEGNKEHAQFVKYVSDDLKLNVKTHNEYLDFDKNHTSLHHTDIVLLFNVIHHLGDDFGDKNLSMQKAKERMIDSINYFHNKTEFLVLQMGFCWKGDRNLLLFENGIKKEMIDFIRNSTKDNWEIQTIGIAEDHNGKTVYNVVNDINIERNDALGEFRNRPIFILKSKYKRFRREEELIFLDGLVSDYKDESPYSRIKKNIILDLITSSLDVDLSEKKALQLGCSNGYETEQLSKIFKNFYVADGSKKFISKVRNLYPEVNFVHTLFEEIDENFINQKFDFIFCNYVLEHVFDSVLILEKLESLLNKNGIIFIVVPNANAMSRQLAQEMGLIDNLTDLTKNDLIHGHRRVYTYDSLLGDIKKTDLYVVEIKGVVFKILADFQLNELLVSGFLNEQHILGMHELAQKDSNIQFSDSFFAILKSKNG